MTDARQAVLARIREGLPPPGTRNGPEGADGAVIEIPRAYRREGSASRMEVLDLFAHRVSDYRASVVRVPPSELHHAVSEALERRGVRRLAIPEDLPDSWLKGMAEENMVVFRDEAGETVLSFEALASSDGVVTGCALAIAETGTVVLDSGPAQGRRALTLLPDYHLCVVFGEQVVQTVPEAVERMGAEVTRRRRPFTLVSGPSATSDIELIRVEGVHGPRTLDVILVAGSDSRGVRPPAPSGPGNGV